MTAVTQIQMLLKYKYKYNDRGQPSGVQMEMQNSLYHATKLSKPNFRNSTNNSRPLKLAKTPSSLDDRGPIEYKVT